MRALRAGTDRGDVSVPVPRPWEWPDLLLVLGLAAIARLVFLVLLSNTYDFDEFVILLLGRDFSHGATPYHSFMFFHPPGVLVLVSVLQPLITLWWPAARLFTAALDCGSALLVWRVGTRLYGRRAGLAAGLLYAVNPLALISAGRVGQDTLVAFLGTAGLCLLLAPRLTGETAAALPPVDSSPARSRIARFDGPLAAVAAGACLGIAIWIKYPAVYYLPIYVLAAPRRAPLMLLGGLTSLVLLFLPFRPEWAALYQQTVTFQRTRWTMTLSVRLETAALYWLAVNALAVVSLYRVPRPGWLAAGFLLGGPFVASPQVYYHYFVLIVPIACLLAAPVTLTIWERAPRALVGVATPIVLAWGLIISLGGPNPLYVTAAHLSSLKPTIAFLDQNTLPSQPILGDQLEYAYLARRPALADYFWNIGVLVDAGYLENRVGQARAVVLSYGASSGYPGRFIRYLNSHFPGTTVGHTTVWLVKGHR